MKSPFKFLSAYTQEDKEVFFGREEEVKALYDLVKKNRLVLVYGPSGTGKTSIVSCGLASKFEMTDWYMIRVNRLGDINQSLKRALTTALPGAGLQQENFNPKEWIEEIYTEYLRPVYLIFDQFEELFIFGKKEEQEQFIHALSDILNAQGPCRILIILREEYLARLYAFEKKIPSMLDRRLRIEPMAREKLLQVVSSSCKSFNISFDDAEKVPAQLVDNLSNVRSGMALPYLQVYLDMIYKRDFVRTYHRDRAGDEMPPLTFSQAEIDEIGEIENVLELYLNEQVVQIQKQLRAIKPTLSKDFVLQLLDAFASESGTKRGLKYKLKGDIKTLDQELIPGLESYDDTLINACLKALEEGRILLDNEGSLELAHDSLAAVIDKNRSDEQRQVNRVRRRLENAYLEYQASGAKLNKEQLWDIKVHQVGLFPFMKKEWNEFIVMSETALALEEDQRFLNERKKRKTAMIIAMVGLVLGIVATGTSLYAFNQFINIRKIGKTLASYREAAVKSTIESQVQLANTLKMNGQYTEAISKLDSTVTFIKSQNRPLDINIETKIKEWSGIRVILDTAEQMTSRGELEMALQEFKSILKDDKDQFIESKIIQVETRIQKYQELFATGRQFEISKRYKQARRFYQDALKEKPGDPEVLKRLEIIKDKE